MPSASLPAIWPFSPIARVDWGVHWLDIVHMAPLNGKRGGILFHGTDGTLFIDRQGFEILPESRTTGGALVDRTESMKVENSSNNHQDHLLDFIECVKTRRSPRSDIEIGHRSTSTALLGNIAFRSTASSGTRRMSGSSGTATRRAT